MDQEPTFGVTLIASWFVGQAPPGSRTMELEAQYGAFLVSYMYMNKRIPRRHTIGFEVT